LIGLAESHRAFHQNRVEESPEIEPPDLALLSVCRAVGDQRELDTARAKPANGVDGFRQRLHGGVSQAGVGARNLLRQAIVLETQVHQRQAHYFGARDIQVEPAGTMALWVAPEPAALPPDRGVNFAGGQARKPGAIDGARLGPARVDRAAVIEDGVVEVEQQRFRRWNVFSSSMGSDPILSSRRQPFEQLDLSGVIEIVGGDA
jgi:hypothetical protein